MIDEDLNPHLIEFNYLPSFKTDAPVDKHVKEPLIEDTLNLIKLSEVLKRKLIKTEKIFIRERRK